MILRAVNKPSYRSVNNQVQVGLVALLAILSVIFGQLMIAFFGVEPIAGAESTGNFHLNFTGVILALMVCTVVVKKCRVKPKYEDVYYVWQLKQLHNKIYRKLTAIQQAAANNDKQALTILFFYYRGLALVYELDNNTLTITNVNAELAKLQKMADAHGWEIESDLLSADILNQY